MCSHVVKIPFPFTLTPYAGYAQWHWTQEWQRHVLYGCLNPGRGTGLVNFQRYWTKHLKSLIIAVSCSNYAICKAQPPMTEATSRQ
jgi:hypothetical protein